MNINISTVSYFLLSTYNLVFFEIELSKNPLHNATGFFFFIRKISDLKLNTLGKILNTTTEKEIRVLSISVKDGIKLLKSR